MSESYITVELNRQPIELCKLLKIANLVSGGGEAKIVISEGYVYLNGEVEYQKRKKVYHQDIIEFNGDSVQVLINEDLKESLDTPSHTSEHLNKSIQNENSSVTNQVTDETTKQPQPNSRKRKPISF